MRNALKWCWITRRLFSIVLALVVASELLAGSGDVIRTPPAGIRNTSGLKLAIDTQWVDASGYRDVRVQVATATGAPAAADRDVLIELTPNTSGSGNGDFTVRQFITLPQGTAATTAHILVPQNQPWHEVDIDVAIDGRTSKMHSSRTSFNNNVGGEWSEAVPAILVIDDNAPTLLDRHSQLTLFNRNSRGFQPQKTLPDVRAVEMLVRRNVYGTVDEPRPRDMEILRRVSNTPRLEMLPPQDLPKQWIGLTCFDLIIIDHADLAAMSIQHKSRLESLVNWVSSGGNLLIFGMGDGYEKLNVAEKLFAMSPMTEGSDYESAGWKPAESRHYNDSATRTFQRLEAYGRWYDSEANGAMTTEASGIPDVGRAFETAHQHKFLHRPLGMGLVLAMASENPFPGTTTEWSWVLNDISENRSMWYRRHGLSLRRKNNDYWEFLVPNTGKAPVFVFCALITLFAIVIGPVNYFFLARQRRLYLLLVTIPLGAALVTFCLVAYAVVADGLGTQVRVRSYTIIDQNAGRAVDWSRQSYYAGMAPSRGLTFPDDTAVYTVEQFPNHEEDYRWTRQKVMQWNDQGQNLRTGYMTSRITSQFLAVHAGESSAALQLDRRDGPSSARNQLGGKIIYLLLRDPAGELYMARDVPDGEKFTLLPADFKMIKGEIFTAIVEARPAEPDGLDPNQFEHWAAQQWYGWNMIDNGLSDPRCGTSLLEDKIRWVQNVQEKDFPNATYIAIVDVGSQTPLGVKSRESGSLHIVEGKF